LPAGWRCVPQAELDAARKEIESLTSQLQTQGAKLNDDEAAKRRKTRLALRYAR